MKAFLLLVAITAFAAPSSVKIANPSTSPITSVKTLVWGFKKGDIAHYPRPSYAGTPLTAWQTDQVRRWSDGSVKVAIISFPVSLSASETRTIDWVDSTAAASAGSGLTEAGMLAFNSANWNAAAQLTYNGASVQTDARTLLNDDIAAGKTCGGAGSRCSYWLNGPVVTDMILQGPLDDQTNFFQYTMGFDQGHGGNNKPVRPRFEVRAYPSWPNGVREVVTILNDMSTRLEHLSFNYAVLNGPTLANLVYPAAPSVDDCTTISTCDMVLYATTTFRKMTWDGAAPPVVNTTDYAMQYKADSGLFPNWDAAGLAATGIAGSVVAYWQSQWTGSDKCADSTSHGNINQVFTTTGGRWDLGPATHLHALALFAPSSLRSIALGESECSMNLPNHMLDTRTGSALYCAMTCTGANATAPAFGRFPSTEARPTWMSGKYGNAWDFVSGVATGDKTTPIYMPNTSVINGWTLDGAHHPDLWYAAFFLSDGDYYYYSELLQFAFYTLAELPAGNASYLHHGNWTVGTHRGLQTRGYAWIHRTRGNAITLLDQSDPAYQMLTRHWEIDARVGEGMYEITTGNYPPSDPTCAGFVLATSNNAFSDDSWCWGKLIVEGDQSTPPTALATNKNAIPVTGPYRAANKASSYPINYGPSGGAVVAISPPWQGHYKQIVANWNLHREITYESAVYDAEAKGEVKTLMSPNHNRWLGAEAEWPFLIDNGSGPGAGDSTDANKPGKYITATSEWRAAWRNGFVDPPANCTTSPPNTPFNFDTISYWRCTGYYAGPGSAHTQETYVYILKAAAAGYPGHDTTALDGTTALTGQSVWDWINGSGVVVADWSQDPRYDIVPYGFTPSGPPETATCACALSARRSANKR